MADEVYGYCMRCKIKKDDSKGIKGSLIKGATLVTMKNGRKAYKGNCAKCDTKMFRITGN